MAHLRAVAAMVVVTVSSAGAAGASSEATVTVPLPLTGNVSVTRVVVEGARRAATAPPRLSLAARSVPATTFVISTVARSAGLGRFQVTVAAIDTGTPVEGSTPPVRRAVALMLPAGFRVVSPARGVNNVLYQNPIPTFGLVSSGTAQVLAGQPPGKLAPAQMVRDAQLLALERSVPLADMQVIGLQFVTLQLPASPGRTVPVAVGISRLGQVNAVELRFPAGITVVRAGGPPAATTLPAGTAVQFVASSGFFDESVQYPFSLQLSRAPKPGEFILVRASTHYFESVLPFRERFVVS